MQLIMKLSEKELDLMASDLLIYHEHFLIFEKKIKFPKNTSFDKKLRLLKLLKDLFIKDGYENAFDTELKVIPPVTSRPPSSTVSISVPSTCFVESINLFRTSSSSPKVYFIE